MLLERETKNGRCFTVDVIREVRERFFTTEHLRFPAHRFSAHRLLLSAAAYRPTARIKAMATMLPMSAAVSEILVLSGRCFWKEALSASRIIIRARSRR